MANAIMPPSANPTSVPAATPRQSTFCSLVVIFNLPKAWDPYRILWIRGPRPKVRKAILSGVHLTCALSLTIPGVLPVLSWKTRRVAGVVAYKAISVASRTPRSDTRVDAVQRSREREPRADQGSRDSSLSSDSSALRQLAASGEGVRRCGYRSVGAPVQRPRVRPASMMFDSKGWVLIADSSNQ